MKLAWYLISVQKVHMLQKREHHYFGKHLSSIILTKKSNDFKIVAFFVVY